MKIKYTRLPDHTRTEGYSYYPFAQVFLRNGVNMQSISALIDSGSVDSIFPGSLGEVLGIDVPSGAPYMFKNFNLHETHGFVHPVALQVSGFSHWIEINVAFIQSEKVVPILGQLGFFENYQIVFERFRRTFEINTKVDAIIRNKRGHDRAR